MSFAQITHILLKASNLWIIYCILTTFNLEKCEVGGSDGKDSACNVRDLGLLIPGPGRSPGDGNGYPLQDSCLENSIVRGAWRATVHGTAELNTTKRLNHHHNPFIDQWLCLQKGQLALPCAEKKIQDNWKLLEIFTSIEWVQWMHRSDIQTLIPVQLHHVTDNDLKWLEWHWKFFFIFVDLTSLITNLSN